MTFTSWCWKNLTQSTVRKMSIKIITKIFVLIVKILIPTILLSKNSEWLEASQTVKTESVCKIRIFLIKMEINPPLLIANLYQPSSFISVLPNSPFNSKLHCQPQKYLLPWFCEYLLVNWENMLTTLGDMIGSLAWLIYELSQITCLHKKLLNVLYDVRGSEYLFWVRIRFKSLKFWLKYAW